MSRRGKNHNYELSLVKATCLASGRKFLQFFHSHSQSVYSEEETYLCFEAKQGFLTRLILIVKINSKMKEGQYLSVITSYLTQDLQTLQKPIVCYTSKHAL